MASTNSQQGNTRTMSGLNNVNANSVNSDEIDTTTLRTTNLYTTYARGTFNFDEQLPQSTITPTNSTDLVTKSYVDSNTGSTTLQQAYDNSLSQPQITISTTDGALIMKQEATIPEVLQIQDSTGVVRTSLLGNGKLECGNIECSNIEDTGNIEATGSIEAASLSVTGAIQCSSFTNGTVDNTELNYLDGATSNIQAQINSITTTQATLAGNNTFTGVNTFTNKIVTDTIESTAVGVSPDFYDNLTTGSLQIARNLTTGNIQMGNGGPSDTSSVVQILGNLIQIGGTSGSSEIDLISRTINVGASNVNTSSVLGVTCNVGNPIYTTNVNIQSDDDILVYSINGGITLNCIDLASSTDSANLQNIVAGVEVWNGSGGSYDRVPLYYTTPDLNNHLNQAQTSGTTDYTAESGTAVGEWVSSVFRNINDRFLVMPNFGIIGYANINYGGSILINFRNTTKNPVTVRGSTQNSIDSVRIFYKGAQLFLRT